MHELYDFNMKLINDLADKYGKELLNDITEITEDCWHNDVCSLVDEPQGENQNEEYKIIKEVWVDQWSVGDSGDNYEGRIFCKVKNKVWLMIPYSFS